MRTVETDIFIINNKRLELPLYQAGDRVRHAKGNTTAIGAKGTVTKTTVGGLFVDVKWDQESYDSLMGSRVMLGSGMMVNGIEFIPEGEDN